MTSQPAQDDVGPSLGLFLILVGALTLALTAGVPETTLGDNHDPGPRAFPTGLALCLLLGGIWDLLRWGVTHWSEGIWSSLVKWIGGQAKATTDLQQRDVLILLVAVAVYVPAIVWLGFVVSTLVFAGGMMLRLGARWWIACLVSGLLVTVVHTLFVVLFKVQLPAGAWSWPW